MKLLKKCTLIIYALLALFVITPTFDASTESKEDLKKRINQLEQENEKLRPRTKFTEKVIPRGTSQNWTWKTLTVYVPENASNIKIEAFMKNEPWGGAQNPPKPNTDDLGSSSYAPCPMGTGECAISWSKVSSPTTTSLSNGRVKIEARFANWAHRNDRTGKLQVTYQVD